jgi:hypothetical protein
MIRMKISRLALQRIPSILCILSNAFRLLLPVLSRSA